MGDIFSKKTQSTTNTTNNQQVALQGQGQVGISGSYVSGPITVESLDADVAMKAIESAAQSTNATAVLAAGAIGVSRDVAFGALANSNRALDTADNSMIAATAAINGSHQSVMHVLDALKSYQQRSLETVDSAVMAAQQTALLATPQSPAAYAEITKGQDQTTLKYAGIGIVLTVVAVLYFNRKQP